MSLFTAISFTRVLMEWRPIRRGRQPLSISGLAWLDRVGASSLDVMRHRWLGLSVSALLPMAIAGGNAVASFAVPMVFGILVGTSSSLFIAAPLLLLLGERRTRRGLGQLRLTPEQTLPDLAALP